MTTTTALTEVHLINVPLENNYEHTLYFETQGQQLNYFRNLFRDDASAYTCTYQRREKLIRYPSHYDLIKGYNYVVFKNEIVKDNGVIKQFTTYAFINKMEYINDKRTDIYIETDVMQTYMFDMNVKQSFVEREHVNDDTFGKHTLDEGLETGEYVNVNSYKWWELTNCDVVIGSTVDPETLEGKTGGVYGNIYSGVKYYTYDDKEDVTRALQNIATNKDVSAISSLFLAPKFLLDKTNHVVLQTAIAKTLYSSVFVMQEKLDGYTPKNKKLLCYPYNYLLADVKNGGASTYRWEHFAYQPNTSEKAVQFIAYGVLTPGCSIIINPLQYCGIGDNHIHGMTMGKFPQCNWATDQYTNWLTQNGVNIGGLTIDANMYRQQTAGLSMIGEALTLNAEGVMNSFGTVLDCMVERNKAQMIPPQTGGNINCGDVLSANNLLTLHLFQMTIRKEYAQKIDKFFDMYGYKVNEVKTPLKNHRKEYWFTKTIAVNIEGSIPNDDLEIIKRCYNNGITFWKHPENIRNYSVDNSII